jgi:5-methylcytosine-specific restriction protein A
MVCIGYEWAEGPDKEGRIREIIRFYLAPIQSLDTTLLDQESYNELRQMPLEHLWEVALQEAKEQADSREARIRMWRRSQAIRRYALQRAQGQCEACDQPAPFRTPEGEPFLEVHHIQRLSDGGPDHPERVAAICPNCHRRAHYADDAREFNEKLARKIQEKEKRLFGRRDDRRK